MNPRARPPQILAGLALALLAILFLLGVAHPPPGLAAPSPSPSTRIATSIAPISGAIGASLPPPSTGLAERADAHFVRWYRAPLAGGLLTFPPSFASEDGTYDLVVHFNGNTDLVEESYGYAGVNAVVMISNLGVGSGLYEDRFADPAAFALILARVQWVMEARGLRSPKLGRIALSSWSSGYGGVLKVLHNDALFERIDAVLLLDSIHCGVVPWTKRPKADQIDPLRRFARKAAEGRALLSINHSEIETYGYLNAHLTTDLILDAVGLRREPASTPQPMPVLHSMIGVLPKALMVPLPPLTEAHRGALHVRGYGGNGPVTHMMHLVQMSTTALPDLVKYWRR